MPLRNLKIKERVKLISDKDELNLSNSELSKKYHVSERTVRRILNNKENIYQAKEQRKGEYTWSTLSCTEFDEKVVDFIKIYSNRGIPLNAKVIKKKAVKIAEERGNHQFKATNGWFEKFCKRNSIRRGKISEESLSVNEVNVKEFIQKIPKLLQGVNDEFIFNCDETGIFYRLTSRETYHIKGDSQFGDKIFKQRLTVMFCVNKVGQKLTPLVIGKSKRPHCFKANKELYRSLDVQYSANDTAWVTQDIFKLWLSFWNTQLKEEGKKIVLLLDNFSGHNVNQSDYEMIRLEFLPANSTSKTQPLDAGIIWSFKCHYTNLFLDRMFDNLDNIKTIQDYSKKVTVLDALVLICEAWSRVESKVIVNCWSKCGFLANNPNNQVQQEKYSQIEKLYNSLPKEKKQNTTFSQFFDSFYFDNIETYLVIN